MVSWNPGIGNGQIPTSLLVDYDGQGHYLHGSAANSLRAFSNAFAQAFGSGISISEGYRTYATQVYYWNLYQSGKGYPAARPGTSTHGEAVAVDINSWVYGSRGTAKHNWLVANAPRFGWSWELVGKPSGEAWHFNYVGPLGSSTAGGNSTPIELDDMYDSAAREEVVGRMDREIIPALRNLQQFLGKSVGNNELAADLKNALRREVRYRLYRRTSNGGIIAVNWATGHVRQYANPADLNWDVQNQVVALIIDANGTNPERAIEKSDAEFQKVYDTARAIFESKTGVSNSTRVVTQEELDADRAKYVKK